MIRVVLDTNIVVSAALSTEGAPAAVLDLALGKHILMLVMPAILSEYEKVLQYPKLKLDPVRVAAFLSDIRRASQTVVTHRTLSISRDESDNRFYECADGGNADYIVTGNIRHFPVRHKKTEIVTPSEFIARVASDLARGE
jgi:uncharacterized protein